jgi:hypothetical protein
VTTHPSRRDILASSMALAAGAAIPSLGAVSTAMADSSAMSASEIVAAIRDKKISATDVAKAAFARADQVKDLNALILLNRDPGLAAAAEIDSWSRPGPLPLAGLPIVVKDNINTSDMPTSAGTPALQHARPTKNAPSLQKLLDAGAIIIGKTNMHELAFGITSTNLASFAGAVKNPYDRTRIPGGSSGGTSAAIAARIVTCGLGSDTGGSTRVPAALTGTVGLRPSVGNGGAQRRYHDDNLVVPISHRRRKRIERDVDQWRQAGTDLRHHDPQHRSRQQCRDARPVAVRRHDAGRLAGRIGDRWSPRQRRKTARAWVFDRRHFGDGAGATDAITSLNVIARSACDEVIQLCPRRNGLLRLRSQ